MEDYIARAYQIAAMSEDLISRLHAVEERTNELVPNWNIQQMFGLGTIKDRFSIPDDSENQASHARKLKSEIDLAKHTATDYGFPNASNMPAMHSFDWAIYRQKDLLPFMYSGRASRGRSLAESV